MANTPRSILALALVLSLLGALVAAGGIVLAAIDRNWFMLAFQCVALVAASMGVLIGANRIRTGHAIGLLCTGAVVGVTSLLSEPSIVGDLLEKKTIPVAAIAGVNIVPFVAGLVAASVSLAALAGLIVLLRKPGQSFPLLVKGLLLAIPVAGACAAITLPTVRATLFNLNPLAQTILVIVGAFILGVLTSISGHCIIRAFEIGGLQPVRPNSPTTPA